MERVYQEQSKPKNQMKDPRVDNYIEKSADFAQPILNKLRKIIHKSHPEIKETIKWGFPNFEYKGSILCSMASFKNHCSFGFWLGSKMKDTHKIFIPGEAMGNLGKITSVEVIPDESILLTYFFQGIELIDKGVKLSKPQSSQKKSDVPPIPQDLEEILNKNPKARLTFDSFSPSNKKEYIVWIEDAKSEATRNKRLMTAIEYMNEGKTKNWKYERK